MPKRESASVRFAQGLEPWGVTLLLGGFCGVTAGISKAQAQLYPYYHQAEGPNDPHHLQNDLARALAGGTHATDQAIADHTEGALAVGTPIDFAEGITFSAYAMILGGVLISCGVLAKDWKTGLTLGTAIAAALYFLDPTHNPLTTLANGIIGSATGVPPEEYVKIFP